MVGDQHEGEIQEDATEDEEPWEVVLPCQKTPKRQHFRPVVAARKSTRISKPKSNTPTGITLAPPINSFSVLNFCDDDYLVDIADSWDCLGNNSVEIHETISAMKMEELARASLAGANFKRHLEEKLKNQHVLEGENLALQPTANEQRGVQQELPSKPKTGKKIGGRLSREVKHISLQ